MDISRSVSKLFVAQVLNAIIGFVAIAAFARELGPSAMGVFFLFQALSSIGAIAGDAGVGTAAEKRLSGGDPPETVVGSAVAIKTVTSLILVVAVLAARGYVNDYVGAPVAGLLALSLVVTQASTLTLTILNGELRVGETAVIQFARQIAFVAVAALLVVRGEGARGLVIGSIAGSAAALVWGLYKVDSPLGLPTWGQIRSLAGYAKYNFLPTVGLKIHNWMDLVIIGWLLTSADVGAYEIAWRVAGVTTLLTSSVASTILPQTSAWQAEDQLKKVERLVGSALTPAIFFIVPATFGVLVLGKEILSLVFGPEYAYASLVLLVLVAGKVPEAVQGIVGKCLLGLDRPDLVARATVVAVVLNLALNVALVYEFGLIGAALATTLSFAVGTVLRTRYLLDILSVRVPASELGWLLVSSIVMAGVLVAVESAFPATSLLSLAALVLFGALVFGLVVLASSSLRQRVAGYARTFVGGSF